MNFLLKLGTLYWVFKRLSHLGELKSDIVATLPQEDQIALADMEKRMMELLPSEMNIFSATNIDQLKAGL